MIRLDISEYCTACCDFEPDVTKPMKLYTEDQAITMSDTIIRCKNAKRCESIKRYLERQSSKGE